MLEFYTTLLVYLLLGLKVLSHLKSFSNLRFLGLAFFTSEIFWNRIVYTVLTVLPK